MNLIFLSLEVIHSIYDQDMYADVLREFIRQGHRVYTVSPLERRTGEETSLVYEENSALLRLKVGNIQKTNLLEKGISTITIQDLYIHGIQKYFPDVRFDLILYATPPITFCKTIAFLKRRDGAESFLLLKDIFPQNAVDLGMFSKRGLTAPIYYYFRRKEKLLYALSDRIGCMSPANVDYLLRENPEIDPSTVSVCPNSRAVRDNSVSASTREDLRKKYGIPQDKTVFVYGGNLGRPQGIPFLIECLKTTADIEDAFFLIVGDGTEYSLLEDYMKNAVQENCLLMKRLPREDYDVMVGSCDVGMIFLDHRFTIPNFPSRILSYMQAKLPVLACTDPNTDMGKVIQEGRFGWWCESNDPDAFRTLVLKALASERKPLGENAWQYFTSHYSAEESCRTILSQLSHCR